MKQSGFHRLHALRMENDAAGFALDEQRARHRKGFTLRKVHDVQAPRGIKGDVSVSIYPNGLLVFRERGKRKAYETTAGKVLAGLMWSEAMTKARTKAAEKQARKAARKGAR